GEFQLAAVATDHSTATDPGWRSIRVAGTASRYCKCGTTCSIRECSGWPCQDRLLPARKHYWIRRIRKRSHHHSAAGTKRSVVGGRICGRHHLRWRTAACPERRSQGGLRLVSCVVPANRAECLPTGGRQSGCVASAGAGGGSAGDRRAIRAALARSFQ